MASVRTPRDYYSKAIRYFREHPDKIFQAWLRPDGYKYGLLFAFLSKGRNVVNEFKGDANLVVGCPSLIKARIDNCTNQTYIATTENLTKLCQVSDLPINMSELDENDEIDEVIPQLKTFAKIQRIADKEMNRKPPKDVS